MAFGFPPPGHFLAPLEKIPRVALVQGQREPFKGKLFYVAAGTIIWARALSPGPGGGPPLSPIIVPALLPFPPFGPPGIIFPQFPGAGD